jgi:ankyrin repeat protein
MHLTRPILFSALVLATCICVPSARADGPEILEAVVLGDTARVRAMLTEHPELINAIDDHGATPLHAAVRGKQPGPMVALLIECGADVNAVDAQGMTPLHAAARQLDVEAVRMLLAHGARVDARGKQGATALHVLAAAQRGPQPKSDAQTLIADALMAAGAPIEAVDSAGLTPLHVAAAHGAVGLVDRLLIAHAKVEAVDADGQTALHWAAAGDHVAVMKRLLAAGADVDARDAEDETPLHHAVRRVRRNATELLIDQGADVNAVDKNQDTPLLLLAAEDDERRAGDDARADLAKVLIDAGARVELRDAKGASAAELAREQEMPALADALENHVRKD